MYFKRTTKQDNNGNIYDIVNIASSIIFTPLQNARCRYSEIYCVWQPLSDLLNSVARLASCGWPVQCPGTIRQRHHGPACWHCLKTRTSGVVAAGHLVPSALTLRPSVVLYMSSSHLRSPIRCNFFIL